MTLTLGGSLNQAPLLESLRQEVAARHPAIAGMTPVAILKVATLSSRSYAKGLTT
jgi:hypothetical protein